MAENPFIVPSANVLSVQQARETPCVLTDASSLARFSRLSDPDFAQKILEHHTSDLGFTVHFHLLQSIVLHEFLLIDSILLDGDQDAKAAMTLCPTVIRGVYLPFGTRKAIGDRLQSMVSADTYLESSLNAKEFESLRFYGEADHAKLAKLEKLEYRSVPLSYTDDPFLDMFRNGFPPDMPSVLLRSSSSIGRAHFYIELASELQIPLAPDPHKSVYIKKQVEEITKCLVTDIPAYIVERFDAKVTENLSELSDGVVSAELRIPAIPEYIIRFARKRKVSLLSAALEVRDSKHARNFRDWSWTLTQAVREGRSATERQQKMLRELNTISKAWSKDVNEKVRYQTRKIDLAKVPHVGGLLKSVSMNGFKIHDPVLTKERSVSSLIFLNDLLRPPAESEG